MNTGKMENLTKNICTLSIKWTASLIFMVLCLQVFSQDTIVLNIAHGSKPRKQFNDEFKTIGGKKGGHVIIQIDQSTYGFFFKGNRIHIFPHRKSKNGGKEYQISINNDIENSNYKINKFRTKKAHMLGFPFMVFILFYTGMFLGILNKNNRLLLLLISTYLTVLPGIYFLSIYFEKLSKERILTAFVGQLCFISTLLLITLGLYFYAKRQVKIENISNLTENS